MRTVLNTRGLPMPPFWKFCPTLVVSETTVQCFCIGPSPEDRLAECCGPNGKPEGTCSKDHLTEEAKATSCHPPTGRHPENGWGLVPRGTCPNPERKRHPRHRPRPALSRQHGCNHASGGTLRRWTVLDLVRQNHMEDRQSKDTGGRHSQPLEIGDVANGFRERLPKGKASPAA